MEVVMQEEFLSEVDLAARWAMSSKTLTRWRGIRRGPPFVKLGKTVRYAMSDILEFERNGLRKPIPQPQPRLVEQVPDHQDRLSGSDQCVCRSCGLGQSIARHTGADQYRYAVFAGGRRDCAALWAQTCHSFSISWGCIIRLLICTTIAVIQCQ